MLYKGGDLNLRSAGAAVPREAPSPPARAFDIHWQRPESPAAYPIAVDELVLACCNGAYDVALFHGSAEVRLEHLLHALTRDAAAVQVLADLGIRVDGLRRDTAVAIATELPAYPAEARSQTRASAALEDALRRASDHAGPQQPVSIRDVIRALLAGGPNSPAAALLMRAAADPQRLERWRDEPLRQALAAPAVAPTTELRAPVLQAGAIDALGERLDRMEAHFQAMREEAAADRQSAAELLHAVQAELEALRARQAGSAAEGVEAVLEGKLGKFGEAMAALAARVGAIDKLIDGDHWQALDARLDAVESRVTHPTELAQSFSATLSDHFGQSDARIQGLEQTAQRQVALQTEIRAALKAAEDADRMVERRLNEMRQAITSLDASQQALAAKLATWHVESGGDIGIVSNRLQQLEEHMLGLLDRLNGEVQSLRQGHPQDSGRGNGFKRWLYGTGSVLNPGTRDEASYLRQMLERARGGEKS